jgi:hypothetical protein
MKVLVNCEESGVVRDAFIAAGHDAWSCDLKERRGKHICGDGREVAYRGDWDLMVAHPPCTRLCNSGVCWLEKRNLWADMREGAEFFKVLMDAPIRFKAIENPIPHKYALEIIGRKYDQIVQPYQFGHAESKATCLWLFGLPKLVETNNVKHVWKTLPKAVAQRMHYASPSPLRAELRSKTYQGIADAMAQQWSEQ